MISVKNVKDTNFVLVVLEALLGNKILQNECL